MSNAAKLGKRPKKKRTKESEREIEIERRPYYVMAFLIPSPIAMPIKLKIKLQNIITASLTH